MQQLSVVIITLNEERNIRRCLESVVGLCNEIVVVDSGSEDDTVAIALEFGAKVVHQPFLGHIQQKNFAIEQALGPWILSLDADEALDPTLRDAILKALQNPQGTAYSMNRLTNYCGHWVKHSGWYPDRKIRLFRKGHGQWSGVNPHDFYQPENNGPSVHLSGDILHHSYYSADDHFRQIEYFGNIAALELYKQGRRISMPGILIKTLAQFMKSYIVRSGFLDGYTGFLISIRSAFATYTKYRKLEALYSFKRKRFLQMKHIVVARTDSIGDVMLTLPLCGLLKKIHPDLKVSFVCKTYTAPIVKASLQVDAILLLDELNEEQLKSINADAIIHAFPDKTMMKLAAKANIPIRIATAGRLHSWVYANTRVFFTRKKSRLHEAQLNLKLLQPLGILETPTLDALHRLTGFSPPTPVAEFIVPGDHRNIILHPLSQGSAAEWGIDTFQALVTMFADEHVRFYITGTATEGDRIREMGGIKGNKVEDLTGKMSLTELIAFIARCDMLIAASTGPLHIAAALGIHAVGLYPNVRPMYPRRWGAIGKNVTLKEASISQEHRLNIPVDEIANVIRKSLHQPNKNP